jgi:hypothetical protein
MLAAGRGRVGNIEIKQHDIGLFTGDGGHCLGSIARLTDDCNITLTLKQDAESRPYKHMIINDKDPG